MQVSYSDHGYTDHQDWLEQLYQPPATPPSTPPASSELADEYSTAVTTTAPKSPPSKPIRRRSRASKKTPTTILNANANNFRSLVQKFTGRPKDAFPLGVHRGPVTLNFGNYREGDNPFAGNSTSSLTSYAFSDQITTRRSSDQGLGRRGMSSFNDYTTASNKLDDHGFLSGSGGSSVAPPPQEEFEQLEVDELPDLARVSEGLSYCSRDYW